MPKYEELSVEQDNVCILAPLDAPIVVTGPPGTGKTVIAFYRASNAAKVGATPRVVVYNNVLQKYASNASDHPEVVKNLSTWHKWFYGWWRSTYGEDVPEHEPFVCNWGAALERVTSRLDRRYAAPWGHLIVDEGQDFPPGFYALAKFLQLGCAGLTNAPVMITVFADENQRLNPKTSSTISQIREALCVQPSHCYSLTRNWRNTREIAAFAAHFYCGLSSGVPRLPEDRRGDLPTVRRTNDVNDSIDHIAKYAVNNDDIDIAVFTSSVPMQATVFNKLEHRLKDHRSIRVQQYTSKLGSTWRDTSRLSFGDGGTVTVLCKQSCKGLEFDAVFVPELQGYKCDPGAEDQFKMDFYVMCSRARTHLCLQYSALKSERPAILKRLPELGDKRVEWING